MHFIHGKTALLTTSYMLLLQASRRAIAPAAFSTCAPVHNYYHYYLSSRSTSSSKAAVASSVKKSSAKTSSLFVSSIASSNNNHPSSAATSTNQTTSSSSLSSSFSTMAAAPAAPENDQQHQFPTSMSEAERYLFDLNGYLIIRNVLTPDQIAAANAAIDAHISEAIPRSDPTLRNAIEGSPMYGTGPPRLDLGGIFEWGAEESEVFKSILAHPRLVPLFHGLLGKGYRLDHIPFVLMNNKGGEGFQLHGGTVDCVSGEYNHNLAYTCHNGNIRSSLLGCNVMLVDHNPGDGGFCVVPGSHKSNFKMPEGMVDGILYSEYIQQPATKAGDVVLFSEGTVHGAMGWQADVQRRCALYRFAPATCGYGRSYFSADGVSGGGGGGGATSSSCSWPSKFYDDLNDAQRAVLEPPYANRLDRPNICEDGTVEITQRSDRKRQHDKEVFKTKYF
jgi:ectoine hydroxylase-related dioxygenase (phytanoyl-CoA dioxygenase family)